MTSFLKAGHRGAAAATSGGEANAEAAACAGTCLDQPTLAARLRYLWRLVDSAQDGTRGGAWQVRERVA